MNEFLQRLRQRKLVQWAIAYIAAAFALVAGDRHYRPAVRLAGRIAARYHAGACHRLLCRTAPGLVSRRAGRPKSQRSRAVNPRGDPGYWRRAALAICRYAVQPAATSATAPAGPTPNATATPSQTAVAIPAKSIAVLPFENLSADKDNAYFADGIQDEILTGLAKIGDLKVISRTSTQGYGSRPRNLAEIGRQLGVAHVLEGSVQKAGNTRPRQRAVN